MLEHIFRNIDDIRIFDLMVEFVMGEDEEKADINKISDFVSTNIVDKNEIMDLLDYGEYKRVGIEDSLDHLVRQKVLGVKKVKMEGTTGCKICRYTDKLRVPRIGEHKKHIAEEVSIGYADKYYMRTNEITKGLRSAAFAHVFLTLDDQIEGGKNE